MFRRVTVSALHGTATIAGLVLLQLEARQALYLELVGAWVRVGGVHHLQTVFASKLGAVARELYSRI